MILDEIGAWIWEGSIMMNVEDEGWRLWELSDESGGGLWWF